ncbi:MAG: lysophospholipase [Acetatifactor sp.]|nr:lysophospholipase [Acetatifactor sp.]
MNLFAVNGYAVMSFDYSGQGASSGTIGFDNAKTDAIPVQIADAVEELHRLSGIDYDHIILVGHSMGGRSILRLLYDYNSPDAQTTVEPRQVRAAILLSPEVNYEFNAQASLFAGTSDASEEPWKSYDPSCIGSTDVYLYGSTGDDIVSDEDVLAIFARIGGEDVPESGCYSDTQYNESGSIISVGVVSGVLHSYEMYSPKFAALVNDALADITGKGGKYPAKELSLIYVMWFLGLAGLGLSLSGANGSQTWMTEQEFPVLEDPGAFLKRKVLMWIPGVIAAVLLCCVCVCMPFGSPVMNIPYLCFIAGYGVVMLWAYRKGTFPGVKGKLPKPGHRTLSKKDLFVSLGALTFYCFAVWYILRASMYRLIPFNARLFWVCFAAVFMAIGYYVSGVENDMLKAAGASRKVKLLYNLNQYVPLLLLVLFYMVLKSYSGMIGQVQNMLLMYIFCIPMGDFLKMKTGSRLTGAVVTGFLFQTLMITSAALISMF